MTTITAICPVCNQPFGRIVKPGRPQMYCSAECYREHMRAKNQRYYSAHRDERNAALRAQYAEDEDYREARKAESRQYYHDHREQVLRWHREYYRHDRHRTNNYLLKRRERRALMRAAHQTETENEK